MSPDEALIRASFFLDMNDFIEIGIPEDQIWYKIYAWRKQTVTAKDEHYLLLQGKHIEHEYVICNDDD